MLIVAAERSIIPARGRTCIAPCAVGFPRHTFWKTSQGANPGHDHSGQAAIMDRTSRFPSSLSTTSRVPTLYNALSYGCSFRYYGFGAIIGSPLVPPTCHISRSCAISRCHPLLAVRPSHVRTDLLRNSTPPLSRSNHRIRLPEFPRFRCREIPKPITYPVRSFIKFPITWLRQATACYYSTQHPRRVPLHA